VPIVSAHFRSLLRTASAARGLIHVEENRRHGPIKLGYNLQRLLKQSRKITSFCYIWVYVFRSLILRKSFRKFQEIYYARLLSAKPITPTRCFANNNNCTCLTRSRKLTTVIKVLLRALCGWRNDYLLICFLVVNICIYIVRRTTTIKKWRKIFGNLSRKISEKLPNSQP